MEADTRAETLTMGLFLCVFDAVMMTVVRALGLYFGFYMGVFVLAPYVVAFDAWSVLPLWSWMLVAVGLDAVHNVVQDWPDEEPIAATQHTLLRASPVWCEVGPGLRHRNPSRGLRHTSLRTVPIHRKVRFGRTRLR